MDFLYKERIQRLIDESPFNIDCDIVVKGKIPTTVSSDFITHKEQGDWAERIVCDAINKNGKYVAVRYGKSDDLSAGDEGFKEFYENYQNELNLLGKRPDLLVFKKDIFRDGIERTEEGIKKAVCAIEVRSSSFLSKKYEAFMTGRIDAASQKIDALKNKIFNNRKLATLLESKNKTIYDILKNTSAIDFKNGASFRTPSWSSSDDLQRLTEYLKKIKDNIKILRTRDYLSITPKLEDIALVNRWIQRFNVPHYYLQVFFDSGYIISFEDILKISSDPANEDKKFSIERDTKNQRKTTLKINLKTADFIMDNISMPEHNSMMKELDRGRLLFYVRFSGGEGYLNETVWDRIIK